jgi:hypothetical protein
VAVGLVVVDFVLGADKTAVDIDIDDAGAEGPDVEGHSAAAAAAADTADDSFAAVACRPWGAKLSVQALEVGRDMELERCPWYYMADTELVVAQVDIVAVGPVAAVGSVVEAVEVEVDLVAFAGVELHGLT